MTVLTYWTHWGTENTNSLIRKTPSWSPSRTNNASDVNYDRSPNYRLETFIKTDMCNTLYSRQKQINATNHNEKLQVIYFPLKFLLFYNLYAMIYFDK